MKVTPVDMTGVRAGDIVIRMLAGKIAQPMKVTHVDDKLIHCGPWTFDRKTGFEVDEEISQYLPARTIASFLLKQ